MIRDLFWLACLFAVMSFLTFTGMSHSSLMSRAKLAPIPVAHDISATSPLAADAPAPMPELARAPR